MSRACGGEMAMAAAFPGGRDRALSRALTKTAVGSPVRSEGRSAAPASACGYRGISTTSKSLNAPASAVKRTSVRT